MEVTALELLKARLRIQHTQLDSAFAIFIDGAKERLTDAGIDIEDEMRKNRILNLIVDISIFAQQTGEKQKVPLHIQYEINNLYFAQIDSGV